MRKSHQLLDLTAMAENQGYSNLDLSSSAYAKQILNQTTKSNNQKRKPSQKAKEKRSSSHKKENSFAKTKPATKSKGMTDFSNLFYKAAKG